tara:strand:- start:207 stop:1112 length:906 start_codon:yes stop_codon:yes gene_type:complete
LRKYFLNLNKLFIVSALLIPTFCQPLEASLRILKIGAVPDQNQELLDRRFKLLSSELSKELKIKVQYVPVFNYVAAVSAFKTGSLDLVWFGCLSGIQARLQTPNARVLAQRDIDTKFNSVFIVNKKLNLKPAKTIQDLRNLRNLRLIFGSENSTSGRLMPQYFLNKAGLSLKDFKSKRVSFSGSHDSTIALVNSGAFDVGALSKQVWNKNVKENPNRINNIEIFWITPNYANYHWLVQGNLDQKFREGFTKELKSIILNLDINNLKHKKILDLFGANKFIESDESQYKNIENIARKLKKII